MKYLSHLYMLYHGDFVSHFSNPFQLPISVHPRERQIVRVTSRFEKGFSLETRSVDTTTAQIKGKKDNTCLINYKT